MIEVAGHVPLPLTAEDYIALLPARWHAINSYGVKIKHRIYDGEELNPLRGQRSGVTAKKNLWEVHYDPYEVSRIWVRNHWDGGWITVFWRHLSTAPAPFGEMAWDHARHGLSLQGTTPTELEIVKAVDDLLRKAYQGPPAAAEETGRKPSRKDRRVAARTTATAQPAWPRPEPQQPPGSPRDEHGTDTDDQADESLADVVPLKVFDARKEAEKWW